MIALPKPKFAETNIPIGKSKDDYRDEIIGIQTHVLNDAIDRVSLQEIIPSNQYYIKINQQNAPKNFSVTFFIFIFSACLSIRS